MRVDLRSEEATFRGIKRAREGRRERKGEREEKAGLVVPGCSRRSVVVGSCRGEPRLGKKILERERECEIILERPLVKSPFGTLINFFFQKSQNPNCPSLNK